MNEIDAIFDDLEQKLKYYKESSEDYYLKFCETNEKLVICRDFLRSLSHSGVSADVQQKARLILIELEKRPQYLQQAPEAKKRKPGLYDFLPWSIVVVLVVLFILFEIW